MITVMDAYILASNNIKIDCGQNKTTRLWNFWIYLMRGEDIHRPVVNSDCVFGTKLEARESAESLVKLCKEYVEK